ncbi:MAG: superoxide dismutase [Candidatus Competibacterales bacterium]
MRAAEDFTLPDLPYAVDALEPHIDALTMEIHHGRHHAGYVRNLNAALGEHPDLQGQSIETLLADLEALPEDIRTAVRNNGGGHLNHTLFWSAMSPQGGGEPQGDLARAIERDFGGYDGFQTQFNNTARSQFGSGWAWLSLDGDRLVVEGYANQNNPVMQGKIPLLGIDVWEHAYYLKYQNRRGDYIAAFANVVDWQVVAERFETAQDATG